MSSSTNKGNISTLLFTLTCIACTALVAVYANLAVGDGAGTGRYENPKVASKVVGGTIYDASGRILAMDVPTDDLYVLKDALGYDAAIQILSLHLDMSPDEVKKAGDNSDEQMQTKDGTYILVKQDIDQESLSDLELSIVGSELEGCIETRRHYKRIYPAAFHSAQIIQDIEMVYAEQLFPMPEFDVSTTYGNDLHLSIDLDVQYLLDLVVQQAYEIQNPDYISAGVVELSTSKLVAGTSYPFYDLNDTDKTQTQNLANLSFPNEFSTKQAIVGMIKVVEYSTDHQTGNETPMNNRDVELHNEEGGIEAMISAADGSSAIAVVIPQDNPKYALYICPKSPKYYTNSTVMEDAVREMQAGLTSQGRL